MIEERTTVLNTLYRKNMEYSREVSNTNDGNGGWVVRSGSRYEVGPDAATAVARAAKRGLKMDGGIAVAANSGGTLLRDVKMLNEAGIKVLVLDSAPSRLVERAIEEFGMELTVL